MEVGQEEEDLAGVEVVRQVQKQQHQVGIVGQQPQLRRVREG